MKVSVLKNALLLTVCLAGFAACSSGSGPDAEIIATDESTSVDADKDTTAPKIVDTEVFTIAGRGSFYTVSFDEAIDADTAHVSVHQALEDGEEIAVKMVVGTDGKSLAVTGDFQKGVIYFADVDVTDLAGNANEPASLKFQLPGADADGDGVEDAADKCPDTPAGTSVVETGCPVLPPAVVLIDEDNDGVSDANDKCPGTLKDWPVDTDGCIIVYTIKPDYSIIYHLFTHDLKIVSSTPADKAENVSLTSPIQVTFDTAVKADSLQSHFKLKIFWLLGWSDVPVKLDTAESTGKTYGFKPLEPLKPGAIYAIVVEQGTATDKGLSTEDAVTTFSTVK